MKAISSSIVISAGIFGIIASTSPVSGHPFSFVGIIAGVVTLALGLVGWWACLKYDR